MFFFFVVLNIFGFGLFCVVFMQFFVFCNLLLLVNVFCEFDFVCKLRLYIWCIYNFKFLISIMWLNECVNSFGCLVFVSFKFVKKIVIVDMKYRECIGCVICFVGVKFFIFFNRMKKMIMFVNVRIILQLNNFFILEFKFLKLDVCFSIGNVMKLLQNLQNIMLLIRMIVKIKLILSVIQLCFFFFVNNVRLISSNDVVNGLRNKMNFCMKDLSFKLKFVCVIR